MLKTFAVLFGIAFVLIAVLGFVPRTAPEGMLFGIFHVNALHNIIHLSTGVIAFWVARKGAHACRNFYKFFGLVYALVAIAGFFYGDQDIFGMIATNNADNWLHALIAAVFLVLGYRKK